MKLKQLPLAEFNAIAATTRLQAKTRDLARAVLVDGRSLVDVAREYGMTYQRVSLAVEVINKAYMANGKAGEGLVSVELQLPENLTLELAALQEAIQSADDPAAVKKEIARLVEQVRASAGRLKSIA